jgi:hypothetical protein
MKGVSKDALDLIKICLEKKADDRVKIMKVLEHKWFVNADKELAEIRKANEHSVNAFKAFTSATVSKQEDDSD